MYLFVLAIINNHLQLCYSSALITGNLFDPPICSTNPLPPFVGRIVGDQIKVQV